jgi:multidrug efflux pump subunit AcrA (membrane-fusion protein)
MNKTVKWILIFAGALLLVFLIVKATGKGSSDAIKVTAEGVKRRTLVETVSASGKLYPETEIKVGSLINGEVTLLNVQEGDTVRKGQVLARIQGEKGASAAPQRISVPNIPPGFEGLLQSMQPPRATSAQTSATITAPISGTVIALNVKKGERIGVLQMPGSEMMRLADMNNMEVRVDVNENNIIKISVGDSADVEVEAYNKRKFKGLVTSIANGGTKKDPQSFLSNDVTNYEVHIRLLPSSYADLFDSSRRRSMPFRPGMNARADIKTKKREAVLSIPVGAVVSKPKGSDENAEDAKKARVQDDNVVTDETSATDELEEVVYVMKSDGTVEKRVVTTGIQDINHIEILSGLKEGEQVVTGPYNAVSKTLRSGKKVRVVPKEQIFQND